MRSFLTLLLTSAALLLASTRALAQEVVPLYQQFRVLSSLPWQEPEATRAAVLARIFQEPQIFIRCEVLRQYLHTALPVAEFPRAFDEGLALTQADFPGAEAEFTMRAWAERDPAAALERCRELFDLVIEGVPLQFHDWKRVIRTGSLEKARAGSYWFGDRGIVHACWKGLAAAPLAPERRNELAAAFREAYFRRFQEDPPDKIEETAAVWSARHGYAYAERPSEAGWMGLLAAAPERIPQSLPWPDEPWESITFPRALIRWMNGEARKAPQIVERVLDVYDPRHFYRQDDAVMDLIPVEFLVEWAILDRAGFMNWTGVNTRGWRAQAVYRTVLQKAPEGEAALRLENVRDEKKAGFNKLWIALDPDRALPRHARRGEDDQSSAALDDLCRSGVPANYWRRAIGPFLDLHHYDADLAWSVTACWAPVDFAAMVKQFGLRWCRRSGIWDPAQVSRMFANREALANDGGLRHTLSALRIWAILRPKEMRAWVEGEPFSQELRGALLWVLENAVGGFAVPEAVKTE